MGEAWMDVIGVEIKPLGHNSEGMVCIDVTVYGNSIRSEDDGIGLQGGLCLQVVQ
jgi:hypothetical protein